MSETEGDVSAITGYSCQISVFLLKICFFFLNIKKAEYHETNQYFF